MTRKEYFKKLYPKINELYPNLVLPDKSTRIKPKLSLGMDPEKYKKIKKRMQGLDIYDEVFLFLYNEKYIVTTVAFNLIKKFKFQQCRNKIREPFVKINRKDLAEELKIPKILVEYSLEILFFKGFIDFYPEDFIFAKWLLRKNCRIVKAMVKRHPSITPDKPLNFKNL